MMGREPIIPDLEHALNGCRSPLKNRNDPPLDNGMIPIAIVFLYGWTGRASWT